MKYLSFVRSSEKYRDMQPPAAMMEAILTEHRRAQAQADHEHRQQRTFVQEVHGAVEVFLAVSGRFRAGTGKLANVRPE